MVIIRKPLQSAVSAVNRRAGACSCRNVREVNMDEKKAKRIKKRSVIIAIVCFMVVVMPVLWGYAIGPRDLTGGGEIYEQRVYYMFHTYRCVGWTMGGNNEVKSGPMIRPGLFQYYYLGEDTDYIIRKEWHERFVFKREDKL